MKTFLQYMALYAFLLSALPLHAKESDAARREAYWYITAGDVKAEETTGQLESEGSSYGLTLGAGVRPWRYLSFEGEIAMRTAKYDSPPLAVSPGGSIDPRMRVTSAGISGNAIAVYDLSRVSVYAGAGLGVFGADAEVTGTVFGFSATRVEDDTAIGYQLIAGADMEVARRSRVGLEYRRLYLEADFGELSRGDVEIGGDYIGLTFRRTFRP